MLQDISFRLGEIPILEDNPADCFPEKYFCLSIFYGAILQPYSMHKTICCLPETMVMKVAQRDSNHGDRNMINRPFICLSN